MKRYKYIGTEEQLVEFGFEMEHLSHYKNGDLIHGTRQCQNYSGEIYIILDWGFEKPQGDERFIQWNDEREADITPYIQDLIDDGLVEALS